MCPLVHLEPTGVRDLLVPPAEVQARAALGADSQAWRVAILELNATVGSKGRTKCRNEVTTISISLGGEKLAKLRATHLGR